MRYDRDEREGEIFEEFRKDNLHIIYKNSRPFDSDLSLRCVYLANSYLRVKIDSSPTGFPIDGGSDRLINENASVGDVRNFGEWSLVARKKGRRDEGAGWRVEFHDTERERERNVSISCSTRLFASSRGPLGGHSRAPKLAD